MDKVSCHLVIRGHVQGVGYRNTLEHRARKVGVSGWVRNRSDGTVEAVIHGSEEQLRLMIEWAKRGPPLARVEEVVVSPLNDAPENPGFIRLSTE